MVRSCNQNRRHASYHPIYYTCCPLSYRWYLTTAGNILEKFDVEKDSWPIVRPEKAIDLGAKGVIL